MLKSYMHKRERHFALLNDNRIVHPFDWGTEYISGHANGGDPRKLFSDYSKWAVEHSDEFFFSPEITDFKLESDRLTWTSGIETPTAVNNTVHAKYFPFEANRKTAVLVLPHWNARAGTYFELCKVFNRIGFSALRMTLPYHEEQIGRASCRERV